MLRLRCCVPWKEREWEATRVTQLLLVCWVCAVLCSIRPHGHLLVSAALTFLAGHVCCCRWFPFLAEITFT